MFAFSLKYYCKSCGNQVDQDIHDNCAEYGVEGKHINYVKGANIAGFIKVANAMMAYGVV